MWVTSDVVVFVTTHLMWKSAQYNVYTVCSFNIMYTYCFNDLIENLLCFPVRKNLLKRQQQKRYSSTQRWHALLRCHHFFYFPNISFVFQPSCIFFSTPKHNEALVIHTNTNIYFTIVKLGQMFLPVIQNVPPVENKPGQYFQSKSASQKCPINGVIAFI